MEEKFYKKIKNTFENPPEFPFEEGQWEKMKERLDQEPIVPQPGYFKKYAWLLLWVLPFLFLGGYTLYQGQQANQKIVTLETALQIEQNKNTILQSDTVFNHIVINQYDTIYHTTTIYNQQAENIAGINNQANWTNNNIPVISQQLFTKLTEISHQFSLNESIRLSPITSLGQIQQLITTHKEEEEKILIYNEAAIKENLTQLDLLGTTPLAIPLRDIHFFRYFEPPTPIYRSEKELLAFMKPTGFNIGVEGSLLKLIHNEGDDQKGFTIGLTTEINYGNNFSLFLGGEYLKLHYELEEDADISAYPIVEPENGQDAFHYLRVNSNYLQIPFGFKYRFGRDKAFRPYLGVGAIARKPIRKELNYEFLSAFEEYYINRTYTNDTFSINTLRGKLGFEYRLHKGWNFYLESTYDHDFRLSPTDFEKVKYFNLRTGVLYKF